jgi:carbamoyltransferase
VCTGGASLNVVNNLNLLEKFKKLNIYIDPMCGDEGNSIGTCQQYLHAVDRFFNPNKNIYLGPNYSIKFNLNVDEKIKKVNTKNIIKLLTDKNIVAIYQQKAEAGPRALGNRSLLMDPRIKNGNDIMNTVKGREKFRPLACCILEEKAKEWFEMNTLKKSPHMMYAVKAKNKTKKLVSSIVHKDNTCRVQTISKKDNPFMYQLLIEFYKKTKVPILMNTSFNLRKKPIVETPDDALETLRNSEFEYLFFPDTKDLIYIENFNLY